MPRRHHLPERTAFFNLVIVQWTLKSRALVLTFTSTRRLRMVTQHDRPERRAGTRLKTDELGEDWRNIHSIAPRM